MKYLFRDK